MNSNTKSKISTVVVFLSTLSIFLLTLPQTISAQQKQKKAEWYCKDGSCYTTRPSSYEGYYECYEKDFTKCPNLSTGSRTATGSASRTSSGSSRPSSTAGARAQTSSRASTGTDSRASARTTTTAQTPSTSTPTSPSSKDAAKSGTEDFTTGSPAKAQSPAVPKNPAAPATGAPPATPGANASGGAAPVTNSQVSLPDEPKLQKTDTGTSGYSEKVKEACKAYENLTDSHAQTATSTGAVFTNQKPSEYLTCLESKRKEFAATCEEATKAAKKSYDELTSSCGKLDKAWGAGTGTCFKNAVSCNQSMQMDQKSFMQNLSQYVLASSGVSAPSAKNNVSQVSFTCPQKSGSDYADDKKSLKDEATRLKERQDRITEELADLKNERETERIATEQALKKAKADYENNLKEKGREAEDAALEFEQKARELEVNERQRLENDLMTASLMIQAASQSLLTISKTFNAEVYNQRCANQAKLSVANDKNLKGPGNAATRKQIAMDIFSECVSKIEGEMFSAKQKAETEKMAAQKKIENIQQSQKLLEQKIIDNQNKLNQMKQRQSEDINLATKQYSDTIAVLANEDKANSNKNMNRTMQLLQELERVNSDLNINMNETILNEASAVSKSKSDKDDFETLHSKVSSSFDEVEQFSAANCDNNDADPPDHRADCESAKAFCNTLLKNFSKYKGYKEKQDNKDAASGGGGRQ